MPAAIAQMSPRNRLAPQTPRGLADLLSEKAWIIEEDENQVPIDNLKTIGLKYSIVLCSNNIIGVGIVAFPFCYQQAGFWPTTIVYTLAFLFDTLSAAFVIEAMNAIPGNRHYTKPVEYTTLVRIYFGELNYKLCQVVYALSIQTQAIASIILSAQVTDNLLVLIFGQTSAFVFTPYPHVMRSIPGASTDDMFGHRFGIVSIGFVIQAILCLPLGTCFNLGQSWALQFVSFVIVVGVLLEFCIAYMFTSTSHLENMPEIGSDMKRLVGVCLFAYAFVVTVPSWMNEKRPEVSATKVLWGTMIGCYVLHVVFGVLGALGHSHVGGNVFNSMQHHTTSVVTHIAIFLFNFGVILPGIPIYAIISRYNLMEGKFLSPNTAFFWSTVAPWLAALLLCGSKGFIETVTWGGVVLSSLLEFIVPALLYLRLKHLEGEGGVIVDEETPIAPKPEVHGDTGHFQSVQGSGFGTSAAALHVTSTDRPLTDEEQEDCDSEFRAVPESFPISGKMCAYIILVSTLGMLAYTIIQDIIYIVEGKNVPTD